jgi:hypothetical protein
LEQRQVGWSKAAAEAERDLGNPDLPSERARVNDLALFNLAIDSKLRGCELVQPACSRRDARQSDIAPRDDNAAQD